MPSDVPSGPAGADESVTPSGASRVPPASPSKPYIRGYYYQPLSGVKDGERPSTLRPAPSIPESGRRKNEPGAGAEGNVPKGGGIDTAEAQP